MLKLVRKPPPPTEGPHAFSDLFSTVVVENNEVPQEDMFKKATWDKVMMKVLNHLT